MQSELNVHLCGCGLTFDVSGSSSGHGDAPGILRFTVKLDAAVHTCAHTHTLIAHTEELQAHYG